MTRSDKARRAIRAATTESEVVRAVREYLDSLDMSDVERLPAEILIMGLSPAEELIQLALQTLHAQIKQDNSKGGILREAALVLTTAARRLSMLARQKA